MAEDGTLGVGLLIYLAVGVAVAALTAVLIKVLKNHLGKDREISSGLAHIEDRMGMGGFYALIVLTWPVVLFSMAKEVAVTARGLIEERRRRRH